MTPDDLRQLLRDETPLIIHIKSGETYTVPHPDFASVSPSGDGVVVFDSRKGTFLRSLATNKIASVEKVPGRRKNRAA